MSAARRNGRRTIFCWCKSACAKAPAAQEKPVRTLSAQKNAGRFAPGNTAFLGRFVQMRRENGRILHKSAACFCTLCLVVTNVRGNTPYFPSHLLSSPARGTWIEIPRPAWPRLAACRVVPRKGDVGRNLWQARDAVQATRSSPARGTWVKIHALCFVVRCAVCRMCSPWNSPHSSRILSTSLLPFRRGTDSPNLLCTHSPSSSTAIMSYSSTFCQSMAVRPPCSYSSTVSPPLVSS